MPSRWSAAGRVRSVVRLLSPRRDLGPMTPGDAYGWALDRYDAWPHVVQVERRGPGVVIIDVSGFPSDRQLARLSRSGSRVELRHDG